MSRLAFDGNRSRGDQLKGMQGESAMQEETAGISGYLGVSMEIQYNDNFLDATG